MGGEGRGVGVQWGGMGKMVGGGVGCGGVRWGAVGWGGLRSDDVGWGEGPCLQPAADAHTSPSGFAAGAGGPLPDGTCAVATGSDSQPGKPPCTCRQDIVVQSCCLVKSHPGYKCLKLLDGTLTHSTAAQHKGLRCTNVGTHGHPANCVQRSYQHWNRAFGVHFCRRNHSPLLLALQAGRQPHLSAKQGQESHVHLSLSL